jgi:hypothetical protein
MKSQIGPIDGVGSNATGKCIEVELGYGLGSTCELEIRREDAPEINSKIPASANPGTVTCETIGNFYSLSITIARQ